MVSYCSICGESGGYLKVQNALVIPDTQAPYEDTRSLAAVELVMRDHTWDTIIQVGDFLDFDCISSHNDRNLRAIARKTVQSDYDYGRRILDRWQRLAPKTKLVIIEGNHEDRVNRYIDANPQMEGMMEVPVRLELKQRGIQWVPYWSRGESYRLGNAFFIHGKYTNEHHAKKHVMRYGVNIFYGHLHDVQCFPLVLQGEDKTIVGQSLGCLCRYDQSYLKGAPTNWQQAFGAFHFYDDGFFTYNVPRIFKHRFYFEGDVYKG